MYFTVVCTAWATTFFNCLIVMVATWFLNRGVSRDGNAIREFVYILPWTVWIVGANAMHLITVQTRPIAASLQVIVFTAWWIVIYKMNMQSDQWRATRIFVTFALQIGIFLFVKEILF